MQLQRLSNFRFVIGEVCDQKFITSNSEEFKRQRKKEKNREKERVQRDPAAFAVVSTHQSQWVYVEGWPVLSLEDVNNLMMVMMMMMIIKYLLCFIYLQIGYILVS
jgi:hypothetical protein